MRKTILCILCVFALSIGLGAREKDNHSVWESIPHLQTQGGRTRLIVDGQAFTMLAGELHNSTTGSLERMAPVWKRMADKNLNTVFAVISWELLEPEEGHFDFSILDAAVSGAREAGLKLGILWFGSWKNGVSTYAPAWVKTDQKRFSLACFSDGTKMNTLSTLGVETMNSDARAFAAMMRHLREIDKDHTVILVQVENEMGALDSASTFSGTANRSMRDFSPLADKAFGTAVPSELMAYIQKNFKTLHPAIASAWTSNGRKLKGTWEEVFGKGQPSSGTDDWAEEYPYLTEEIFMTWNYGRYVEAVAKAGKEEYPLPMFVNAWLKQSGGREPGRYPTGGPLPHVFDIWRAAAPSIDFFAPDIYAVDRFDETCAEYSDAGRNPLVIPETPADAAGAARAFYALGKYGAICYSPFGIDGGGLMLSADEEDKSYDKAYWVLRHLLPQMQDHRTTSLMTNASRSEDSVQIGDYKISIGPFSAARAFAVAGVVASDNPNRDAEEVACLMIISLGPDEFILAGFGNMMVGIEPSDKLRTGNIGLLSVDELSFTTDGKTLSHRLNGDETALGGVVIPSGEAKAFRVKMYKY